MMPMVDDPALTTHARRPNVLMISTHDINPHLRCYTGVWPGAELAHTPNLDALASEGVRFDQAIATTPVCGPSRSAVMTGCFPPSIGTMHMRTRAVPPAEVELLPTYFRRAGYWTANSAFTDFQMDIPNPVLDAYGEQVHWRSRPDPGQPFFLAIHGMVTHESSIYLDSERFAALTVDVTPDERMPEAVVPIPPYHPDTPVFRQAWARYFDLVCQMDHWVGRWLAQLAEDGLDGDTIVVFWSDHGLGMPRAKRWMSEAGVREPLIVRWPGHVRRGSVCRQAVSLMDLAPTLLNMCGLEVPSHMQGQVLMDAEGRLVDELRPYAFSGRDRMGDQHDQSRSVRDDRYRYTRHLHPDRSSMAPCSYPDQLATWAELRRLYSAEAQTQLSLGRRPSILTELQRSIVAPSKPAEELYDIAADPHEQHNLAGRPQYAAVQARLSAALDEWLGKVGDLGDLPETQLLEQWRPGGLDRKVSTPAVQLSQNMMTVTCSTPGSLIGWTTVRGSESAGDRWPSRTGYDEDGRHWRLYTGPTAIPDGPTWIKAWRIGWLPSDEVSIGSDILTGGGTP